MKAIGFIEVLQIDIKQLRTLKSTSVQQLQTMIGDIWLGITAKRCQDLVNTMTTYETVYFSSWWNIEKVLKMIVG